jgi:hypothetical protein
MSGPIVRSAPNKQFSANWDNIFGGKSKSTRGAKAKSKVKPAAKKSAKKKKGGK